MLKTERKAEQCTRLNARITRVFCRLCAQLTQDVEVSGAGSDGRSGNDENDWFARDWSAVFEGLQNLGSDGPCDLAHLGFRIELFGFGESLIDRVTLSGHAKKGDCAAGSLGSGGAVDENGLICGVEREAEGGEVLVGIAGGIAEEVELVTLNAKCLCGQLLAAVARVTVGGDSEVDDGFQA